MSVEKPFEIFPGKIKRLRKFETFADAIDVDQQRKFPVSLKIRYGFLHDQHEKLDEFVHKSFKKLITPTMHEIIRHFQSALEEKKAEKEFVPTICLNLNEIFIETDQILTHIESEIGRFTEFRIRLEANFVNSVKDAVVLLYECLGGKKTDLNFDGTVQELLEFYSKLKRKHTIFITFNDFFEFDIRILNDILHILESNLKELPVFLLIPVLNSGSLALNSFVSRTVIQKFNVKNLKIPSAVEFLDEFFTLAFTDDEFVLHFKDKTSLKMLNSYFSNQFFSLKRFVDALKLLLLDHFRDEIWSIFSCSPTCLDQVFDRISSEIDNFSPEFRRSPMKSPKKKLKILHDRRVADDLRRNLFEFHEFRRNFWLVLRCFRTLLSLTAASKRNERQIYANFLDPEFFISVDWQEILSYVDSFQLDEMQTFLSECKKIFHQSDEVNSCEFIDFIEEQSKNFDSLNEFQIQLDLARDKCADDDENGSPANGKHRFQLRDLQRQLRSQIRLKVETDAFSIRKKEFRQKLTEIFIQSTKFTTENDVSRAFSLPGESALHRFFCASTRNSIRRALLSPEINFGMEKSMKKINFKLDCCHIFELYDKCGVSICTKTMLKNFLDLCRPRKKCDEEIIRSKFYKILVEFEYLGLIKFVPRKKQKIAKLVFFLPCPIE